MCRKFQSVLVVFLTAICVNTAQAQLDFFTVLGPGISYYEPPVGFGGFIKFATPISEADDITLELGFLGFDGNDAGYVPIKLGYLYTFNRSGTGWFCEPQLGYSIGGDREDIEDYSIRKSLKGVVTTVNLGYRFGVNSSIYTDLSLRVESVINKDGFFSIAGIRLAFPISFGRGKYGY